tara:strand:- start:1585 stop:1854 length:270 start_codon:yes stop_codon:yes gene_type:complete
MSYPFKGRHDGADLVIVEHLGGVLNTAEATGIDRHNAKQLRRNPVGDQGRKKGTEKKGQSPFLIQMINSMRQELHRRIDALVMDPSCSK